MSVSLCSSGGEVEGRSPPLRGESGSEVPRRMGTVNDHNWSLEAAAVVCRQLECGAAINASREAHFGPGIGPIWFQYIYCNGTESVLTECSYPTIKDHLAESLSHDGDAGAVCSGKSCLL